MRLSGSNKRKNAIEKRAPSAYAVIEHIRLTAHILSYTINMITVNIRDHAVRVADTMSKREEIGG